MSFSFGVQYYLGQMGTGISEIMCIGWLQSESQWTCGLELALLSIRRGGLAPYFLCELNLSF